MKLSHTIIFLFFSLFLKAQYGNQDSVSVPINGSQNMPCLVHVPDTYYTEPTTTLHPFIVFVTGAGVYGFDKPKEQNESGMAQALYNGDWDGNAVNPKTGVLEKYITLSMQNIDNQSGLSQAQLEYACLWMFSHYRIDTTRTTASGVSRGSGCTSWYGEHISGAFPTKYFAPKHKFSFYIVMSGEINVSDPAGFFVSDSSHAWAFGGDTLGSNDNHGAAQHAYSNNINAIKNGLCQFTNFSHGHCCWEQYYNYSWKANYQSDKYYYANINPLQAALLYSTAGNVSPPTSTITTGTISGSPFCVTSSANASVSIPFTITGSISGTYTAQLSSSSGSFSSPINIGTGTASPISGNIPANTTTGTGYKIRVINGSVIGSANASNLTINLAGNSITPTTTQSIAVNTSGTTLTVTDKSTATSHQWKSNGNNISGATGTTYIPNFASAGTYTITCVSTFACGTITSNSVTINVTTVSSSRIYINPVGGGANLNGCNGNFKYNSGDTLVFRSVINGVTQNWNRITLTCINNVTLINEGNTPVIVGDYYGGNVNVQTPGGFQFYNCTNIHLTGTGTNGLTYGFMDSSVQNRGVGFEIHGISSNIEVDHLEIRGRNAGAWVKEEQLDNMCYDSLAFPNMVIHDISIHDNFIHSIVNEGLYLGSTAPNSNDTSKNNQHPAAYCPNGDTNHTLTARLGDIHVFNNIFDSTGRGAVQLSSADSGFNEINNNTITRSGYSGTYGQGNGVSIGGYTHVWVHDNIIHSTTAAGISSFGAGLVKITNNIVDSSGIKRDGTVIAGANSILLDTRNTTNPSPGQSNPVLTTFDIENNAVTNATSNINTQIYNTFPTYTSTGNLICSSGTYNVPSGINYSTTCNGTPATVTTGTIGGSPFCVTANTGASITIPFTVSGTINSGNTFTAYLSDANGNFASKINIGSVSGTASNTISGSLPANLATGTGYKIRVDASNPATTGTTKTITINLEVNNVTPSASQNLYTNANGNVLTVSEQSATTGGNWFVNGVATSVTGKTYTPNFATAGSYSISYKSYFTCDTIQSNFVNVTVSNPPTPTITTGTISPLSNCVTASSGANIQVPFSTTGSFANSTFTAQLSNISGSFASPVNIGTLSTTNNSGIINAVIPANSTTSGGYQIRVINQSVTGSISNVMIKLTANSIAPTATQNIFTSTNGATLTVTNQATATSVQWFANGNAISGATSATYTPNFTPAGTYTVTCQSTFSCNGSNTVITSNGVTVNVTDQPPPPPQTITTGTVSGSPFCVTNTSNATFSIGYSATGIFNSNNVFAVNLSDANGNFASATVIGTLPTTATAGTINCTIPSGTPPGTNYKLKIISSSPNVVGSTTASFTINLAANGIAPTQTQNLLTNQTGNTLTVFDSSAATHLWFVNGASTGNTSTTYTPVFATAGTYNITCQSTGCATVLSNAVQVIVTTPPTPTIVTGSVSGSPYCVKQNQSSTLFYVPFTVTGIYQPDNVFTVQLSNANGSFTNFSVIGTDSTTHSDSVQCSIPPNTLTGNNYRIRVISSNPVIIGTDNGIGLIVNLATVSISPTGTQNIYTDSNGVTLTETEGSAPISRQWYNGNTPISGATGLNYTPNFSDTGTHLLTLKSIFACGTITSNAVVVNTSKKPPVITCVTTKTPPHDTAFTQNFSKIQKVPVYTPISVPVFRYFLWIFRYIKGYINITDTSYKDSTVFYDSLVHQNIVHDTTICTQTGYLWRNNLDMATLWDGTCDCGHRHSEHSKIPYNPNYTAGNCLIEGCKCNYFNHNTKNIKINMTVQEINSEIKNVNTNLITDGYHTFGELYDFRKIYNAVLFNEWASKTWYDIHKSKKHNEGDECFGGGWFIVMAQLPTGQISNHYELKDWDLFKCEEREVANKWDGHTSEDALNRLAALI